MGGLLDTFIAFKFLRLLTKPWKEWDAYKMGIIDENGKVIKKNKTSEEKKVFSKFHVLIKNLKRLMEKVPGGKSKIGSYAIALKLLKEHANEYDISENLIENNFKKHLEETMTMEDLITLDLNETFGKVLNEEKLKKGTYKVVNNDGTKLKKGELVVIKKDQKPDEVVLGEPLFMVKGSKGNSGYVTPFMLKKVK
jgi:hypothetical protein